MIWSQHVGVDFVVILENPAVVIIFTTIFLPYTRAAAVMIAIASVLSYLRNIMFQSWMNHGKSLDLKL
jgi:hypothetical protein